MKFIITTIVALAFSTTVNATTFGTTKGGANYQTGIIVNKVLGAAGVKVIPVPHRSTQIYLERVNMGQIDFGLSNPTTFSWAYKGIRTSKTPQKNIRFVANLQELRLGIAVKHNSRFMKMEHLKGAKTVSGFKGSPGFRYWFEAVLRNIDGNVSYADQVSVPTASVGAMIGKFAKGEGDVGLAILGAGFVKKWHVAHAPFGIRLLSINNGDLFKRAWGLPAGWDGYELVTVMPNTKMPEIKGPTNIIRFPYLVFAGKHVSNKDVGDFIKGIVAKQDDLRKSSGMFRNWDEKKMSGWGPTRSTFGVPMHEGAKLAYEELKLQ